MNEANLIEPKFDIQLEGYEFLGRGQKQLGQMQVGSVMILYVFAVPDAAQ
jgi:hypothetical protein